MSAGASAFIQVELNAISRFFRIEDLENLLLISLGIFCHLLLRQWRAGCVLAGRVADHSGEIADQKDHVMTEVLKLSELVDQYGVPKVQIGRGRVEAGLDSQRVSLGELVYEFLLDEQLVGATLYYFQLSGDIHVLLFVSGLYGVRDTTVSLE